MLNKWQSILAAKKVNDILGILEYYKYLCQQVKGHDPSSLLSIGETTTWSGMISSGLTIIKKIKRSKSSERQQRLLKNWNSYYIGRGGELLTVEPGEWQSQNCFSNVYKPLMEEIKKKKKRDGIFSLVL